MERRKFLFGVGSAAVGTSVLVGSGAFSSVEADRGIAVEVADDADAYLGLTAESHYADDSTGTLELDFSSNNSTPVGGEGLNKDATTMFLHVFSIHNQGTKTVGIQIDRLDLPDGHMHFFVGEHGGETLSAYDKEDMSTELDYTNPSNDDRVLTPGQELKVGVYFLNEGGNWNVNDDITINALDEGTANHVA